MHNWFNSSFFTNLFTDNYPLHLSTSQGNVPEIHKLLNTGYNINTIHLPRSGQGFGCALHIAIWTNQSTAFTTLLARGANMNILDEGGDDRHVDTPIRLAVRLGRRDMVRELWNAGAQRQMYQKSEGEDVHRVPVESGTLLEVAAYEGQADLVSDLLAWKTDWTLRQRYEALFAACTGFDFLAVRMLLDFQYEPDDLEGIAVFTLSHFYGPENLLETKFGIALLTATSGTAPEHLIHSMEERRARHWREGKAQANIIAALIDEHDALVTRTPQAHQALLNRLLLLAAGSSFCIESLRLLLRAGADPNSVDEKRGFTALQATLRFKSEFQDFNDEGVKELLDYGARIVMLTEQEKTNLEVWRGKNGGAP